MRTPEDAAIAVASLVALSLVSGVLFAVVLQRGRSRVNLWFALFCFSLLVWSLAALAGPLESLRFGADDRLRVYLLSTMIGMAALAFFAFTVEFCGPVTRWALPMRNAAPIVLVVGTVITWLGGALTGIEAGQVQFEPLGVLMIGVLIAYCAAALLLIMMSGKEKASGLRLPGVLVLIAYISLLFSTVTRVPIAIVLLTIAAALAAQMMLRYQLYRPVDDVQAELRVANRDLAQALSDLALERAVNAELNDQLLSAGRDRSEFLDRLGVRLRTPLNTIAGYSELLESGVYGSLNEKQADRVGAISRSSMTLQRLINNMLDLNLLDAGRMPFNPADVSLEAVLSPVFANLESLRSSRGLMLERDLPYPPPHVYADSHRLQQVLHEIVENALRFSHAGQAGADTPSVIVRGRPIRVQNGRAADFTLPVTGWLSDGEWVVIEVVDQGIGIASSAQSQVFEPFFQVDPSTHESGGGLGLSVAKRLVELHEGLIWVKSAPDAGTTVFIALHAAQGKSRR